MSQAIASCRVSTAEQRESGSITRQEQTVQRAAAELGVELREFGRWSVDQSSKTGKNMARKDLHAMREFCKQNKKVKFLIVDEVDRFMRDIEMLYWWEVEFKTIGVKVWYASQPELNTDDIYAKFHKLVEVFKAESSNVERQRKTIVGMTARFQAGYSPRRILQGYLRTETPALHAPDPERFHLLQKAMKDVASGSFTISQALVRLNESGYKQPNNQPLRIDKFKALLCNPYYAGRIVVPTMGVDTQGLHEPMISETEHKQLLPRVQKQTLRHVRKNHNTDFPLSKLLTCANCGGKLVGFWHNNGKGGLYPRYRCRNCPQRFRQPDTHAAFSATLNSLNLSDVTKTRLIRALTRVWRERKQDTVLRQQTLRNRLVTLADKKDGLVRALADADDALRKDIEQSIAKLRDEIASIEQQITEADPEKGLEEFISFAVEHVESQRELWWSLDPDNQARCKQLLFPDGISISPNEKVYTPKLSPIYAYASHLESKKDLPEQESPFWWTSSSEVYTHLWEELLRWRELLGEQSTFYPPLRE